MSEVKKVNVGAAITAPLAFARRGGQVATECFQKHSVSEKFSAMKAHPTVAKIAEKTEILWTIAGLVLIFHGAQFRNLFLCTQLVSEFCYGRVRSSALSLYSDATTAWEKMNEDQSDESKADAKAEPKPDSNKHAQKRKSKADDTKPTDQQREEDAAATKKVLKVMDSNKVTGVFFELCVAAVACHMVMQGGLAKVVVVSHALVKASKEKLTPFLDFSEHEDMQVWTDLFLSFVLYAFFGAMAIVAAPFAFALNVAFVGAQLVTAHGLRVAEGMGRIPGGLSAEAFASSSKGLAMLSGLAAFGSLWQFWALVADSGMGWYFKMLYLPAYIAEGVISIF